MTPQEQVKVRELASAYANPFYQTYTQKSSADIVQEVKPMLALAGAMLCFYDQLQKSTKLNYDATRDQFRQQFVEMFDCEPETLELSAAHYAEQKKELAISASEYYVQTKGSPDHEHLDNWRVIQKNITDPDFEKPFVQALRDARSSELLFRRKMEAAEKNISKQDYFRLARDQFREVSNDKPKPAEPKESGLLQRLGRRLGLSDGPSM